jgi:apolipoprotein D and lipocalin family protein
MEGDNSMKIGRYCLSLAAFLILGWQPLAQAQSERIDGLKAEIKNIALANLERTDNWPAIRAQLDKLIEELVAESGAVQPEDVTQFGGGSWQQIWSDESNPEPPGFSRVWTQIYQVVTPFGYGYNFGVRKTPGGQEITFILRVKVGMEPDGITAMAEITDAFSRMGRLQANEKLYDLSLAVEAGQAPGVVKREAGRFPNGPIGAKGTFRTVFVDETLKLGYAPNSYTGAPELFVMLRKDGPEALSTQEELRTVPFVDVGRYIGNWYQIARKPTFFEEGCFCSRQQLSARSDGQVGVLNSCNKGQENGPLSIIRGTASVDNPGSNSQLTVDFGLPRPGRYWIVGLDKDYRYAVVSDPGKATLYILSKTPGMDERLYREALSVAAEQLDTKDLIRLDHADCTYP